jgi:hypothetical protein
LFETRNLPVSGRYSNGYELDIHSVSDGTTYTSSDVNIVTVDVDGKLTAHSVGTANITVTNGVFKATTKVIVKSKNR